VRWAPQRDRHRTDPALANTLLTSIGLSSEPVTFAPARSPPQAELVWDEAS
jgi:hypothetical protein